MSRLCSSQNMIMSDSRRSLASSTVASQSILELDPLDLDLLLDLLDLDLERDLDLRDLDRLLDLDPEQERELLKSEYSPSSDPSSSNLL